LGTDLKYIGVGAFQNSHAMTSITIPSGLSVLNNYVFDGCENLAEIILSADEIPRIVASMTSASPPSAHRHQRIHHSLQRPDD
jgi:hypothetical protein